MSLRRLDPTLPAPVDLRDDTYIKDTIKRLPDKP